MSQQLCMLLLQALGEVPGAYVGAAAVPALVIAVLFYFDHNVSAQMAQQPEFNLARPPAYAYDLLLLGAYTLACGLLGIPPVNGVLPQARSHVHAAHPVAPFHVWLISCTPSLRPARHSARQRHSPQAFSPTHTALSVAPFGAFAEQLHTEPAAHSASCLSGASCRRAGRPPLMDGPLSQAQRQVDAGAWAPRCSTASFYNVGVQLTLCGAANSLPLPCLLALRPDAHIRPGAAMHACPDAHIEPGAAIRFIITARRTH